VVADQVFAMAPGQLTAASSWLGIVCYTLQIYFDFSGYSDMAIGIARMAGFDFAEISITPTSLSQSRNFGDAGIFLYPLGLEITCIFH